MKASLQNPSIKGQAKKNSSADLELRFLELQALREKVRLAECGRTAAEPVGICFKNAQIDANRPDAKKGEAERH
jgi:hypothetical protein